ncbi:hypothetical protein SEA_SAMBA_33 [Gordonia phage Samba]|nr:hypothetical protein SEA_SAMBA_33 [Gordonia phage Samba]QTF82277.1 hypothetical protein SEA_ZIGGYZOO_33 [Gordonia phage ZiggyZoo]
MDRCTVALDQLTGRANEDGELDVDWLFFLAQSMVNCAALVSKLLWTSEKNTFALERSKHLRDVLAVSDDSILKSRAVRNHVEHFDDRLDKAVQAPPHILVDRIVGPEERAVRIEGMPSTRFLRRIEPETMTFSVLDDGVSLPGLGEAMRALTSEARLQLTMVD